MTLQDQVKEILNDFDNVAPDKIIEILNQIQPHLKSEITQDYLKGKINGVSGMTDEAEKKKFCKTMIPYLDWYLQGNS